MRFIDCQFAGGEENWRATVCCLHHIFGKLVHHTKGWLAVILVLSVFVLSPTCLSLLLEGVEDRLALTYYGNQALYEAMHEGDLNQMRALLDSGASPNSRSRGLQANILPSDYGQPVYYLYPPLVTAIEMERLDMVRLLLERGADPNWRGRHRGATSLMIAARNKQPVMVRALIEAGVDPNQRDHTGSTALFDAVETGDVETVKELLALGANARVATNDGGTVLWYGRDRAAEWPYKGLPQWWMRRTENRDIIAMVKQADVGESGQGKDTKDILGKIRCERL
jgi:ankyrin repeat protein